MKPAWSCESHQTERTGGCWCHAAPRSIRYRIWVCQGFRRKKIFKCLLKVSHITYRFHPESTRIAFSPDIRYQYISINHIMIYHFPCFPISIAISANSLEQTGTGTTSDQRVNARNERSQWLYWSGRSKISHAIRRFLEDLISMFESPDFTF